jgi:hypothetical protein
MAVINGDFVSAAVSLLGPDGTLVTDDCVDSGTGAGGTLSYPLSATSRCRRSRSSTASSGSSTGRTSP